MHFLPTSARPWRRLLIGLLALTPVIAACGDDDAEPAATDTQPAVAADTGSDDAATEMVTLTGVMAQGGPTAQIFPLFMAIENGFYEEEGISLVIEYSEGSSDAARQLAAGNVDFGIFSPAATMQTVYADFPLTAIYEMYYKDTFDIVVPADSDITSMADMQGKVLGVSDLAGGEVPMVRAAMSDTGLVEGADVSMVVAGEGDPTTVRSFEQGRIDAYAGAKRDILLIDAQGLPTRRITPPAMQAFPGDPVVVRTETFEQDRDLLVRFVRATIKGWAWAIANPDETYQLLKDDYANATLGDNPVAEDFWQLVLDYYAAPDDVDPHGTFVVEAWESYMGFLQLGDAEQKALAGPVDLGAVLTDEITIEAWDGLDLDEIIGE
ncbi:MAG TPA: ABC transporter substrate-binding protein [Ilumatobacter sp.]|nr:ABC transporter substrate-binding protein [Ilumatobacter sp.]